MLFSKISSVLTKNHHFKIVLKPNDPFWDFILLRKSMRNTFHTKKKLSEMGLEPGPKWAKFIFSNSLLHKNLEKKF